MKNSSDVQVLVAIANTSILQEQLLTQWMYNYHLIASVIVPINIFLGIPSSVLIAACMPFAEVKIKPKLFFVTIALCGLPSLIFCHLFNLFLMDVLPFWSNNRLAFRFEGLSALACQFARFATGASENLTACVTLLFAFERLFVVSFPFRAGWFTVKRSARYLAAVILVGLGVNCLAFTAYGPKYGDKVNAACSPLRQAADVILATHIFNYFVPNCLLLLTTIWIYIALRTNARRAPLPLQTTSASLADRKQSSHHKTTAILIAIAAIRCVFYIPGSITYIGWQFVPDAYVGFTLRMVANQFLSTAGLVSTCNFIVYVTLIRSYRAKLIGALISISACRRRSSTPPLFQGAATTLHRRSFQPIA